MQIHRTIILVIGLNVSSQLIGTVAAEPQKMHLNPNIKAAVSAKTRNISPEKWPNPFITINDQTVTVSWGKHYDHYKNLQPDEAESFLVGLPTSAWPYGRIIEVSEQGVSNGSKEVKRYRERCWAVIKAAMKRLDVILELGPPSA
jgi:hypothetical protein